MSIRGWSMGRMRLAMVSRRRSSVGEGVAHQVRVFRLQHLEASGRPLHLHQKAGLFLPQKGRHPHHIHHLLAIGAAAKAADQQFGATALDSSAGGENGFRHAMHPCDAADGCSGRRGEAIVSDGWRVGRWFWLPEAW